MEKIIAEHRDEIMRIIISSKNLRVASAQIQKQFEIGYIKTQQIINYMKITDLSALPVSLKEYLRQQVLQGAIERYGNEFVQTPMFTQRAETELQTLCANENTIAYLLLVADYVNFARKMGTMVGPGRSSAAGSLVLYCLKITDIDPLKYGLLFERFYSDTSVLPVIDIDVEDCEYEKVKDYVKQTYGHSHPGTTNILGLLVLTMIKRCLHNIKQTRGIDLDLKAIPQDDERTIRLFQEGRTAGVFQFESEDMRKYLRELVPETFNELLALNALHRPPTIGRIPQFIACKHRKNEISVVEECLEETYGLIVYQEQTMLLAQRIANFSPEESDMLRWAFTRMKQPVLDVLKTNFLSGGRQNGYDEQSLEHIWQSMYDSRFSFLKAHSVCYTWLAYQAAYLKANYPLEFLDAFATVCERDADCLNLLKEELHSIIR